MGFYPSDMVRHDHEWLPMHEADAEFVYEEDSIYIYESCDYVEITGSSYSEKHMETFYETGWECEAERWSRFDLTGIWLIDDEEEIPLAESREEVEASWSEHEEHSIRLSREIEKMMKGLDDYDQPAGLDFYGRSGVSRSTHNFVTDVDGKEYQFRFEYGEGGIDH